MNNLVNCDNTIRKYCRYQNSQMMGMNIKLLLLLQLFNKNFEFEKRTIKNSRNDKVKIKKQSNLSEN